MASRRFSDVAVEPAPEFDAALPPAPGTRAWVVLGMLCFVYVLNFLDRQLLSILAKPIQDSLHISDGQLGLIGGLYFAVFYCFISIPVGWIADKTQPRPGCCRSPARSGARRRWPAAFAANYPQLVAARMTVGFGEAGGVPPSYAIISDYFPPGRRGTALGIYNLGPPIGARWASRSAPRSPRPIAGATPSSCSERWVCSRRWLIVVRSCANRARGGLDPPVTAAWPSKPAASGFGRRSRCSFRRPRWCWPRSPAAPRRFITYGAGNFTTLFLMREKGHDAYARSPSGTRWSSPSAWAAASSSRAA